MRLEKMKVAKVKAARYCAYQERTQQQVRDKLYDLGLYRDEVEEVLTELITENFVNEERFARAFAKGKFRLKKWGRVKIEYELKRRNISTYCIKVALEEIDHEDYHQSLRDLISSRREKYSGTTFEIKSKTAKYMLGKGYESELIWEFLNDQ